MWLKSTGKLIYNPVRTGMKKLRKANDFWLILRVDDNISKYYSWWIKKRFHIELQHPMWGSHITLLDGRRLVQDKFIKNWKKYDGEIITFEYSVELEQHWKFWSLPVRCNRLTEIRHELGFTNNFPFHITIGRENEQR